MLGYLKIIGGILFFEVAPDAGATIAFYPMFPRVIRSSPVLPMSTCVLSLLDISSSV